MNEEIFSVLNKKKVFIFDFDGTIADTEIYHWKAYNEALAKYNVVLNENNIKKYIGHSEIEIYSMIKKDFSIEFDNELFFNNRIKIFLELVEKDNLKPFKIIDDIVNKYDDKIFVLITSQNPHVVNKMFSLWKYDKYFKSDYCYFCHEGIIKKIDIYKNICKYINVDGISNSDIVVLEDSEYYLNIAKSLGITTIGFQHKYNLNVLKSYDLLIKCYKG